MEKPKSPNVISPYRRRLEGKLKPAGKSPTPPLTDRRHPKPLVAATHTKSEPSLAEDLKPVRRKEVASRPPESPSSDEEVAITSSDLYGSGTQSPEWGLQESVEVKVGRTSTRVISSTGGH